MKIEADGSEFDFQDALDAFVFDEKDRSSPGYHGLSHALFLMLYFTFIMTHCFRNPFRQRIRSGRHMKNIKEYFTLTE